MAGITYSKDTLSTAFYPIADALQCNLEVPRAGGVRISKVDDSVPAPVGMTPAVKLRILATLKSYQEQTFGVFCLVAGDLGLCILADYPENTVSVTLVDVSLVSNKSPSFLTVPICTEKMDFFLDRIKSGFVASFVQKGVHGSADISKSMWHTAKAFPA